MVLNYHTATSTESLWKGRDDLSSFNLLDEPWITVIVNNKGNTKDVSLEELFDNAHMYKDLAGDTETQDFAVLRVLLAVLHTVFSRFDAEGNKYECCRLDDRFKQIEEIEEDDVSCYEEKLFETWCSLWRSKKFPPIVKQYLEKWRDRFYLFDDMYPFFQVTKENISSDKINKENASTVSGKNINRLISESGNKIALFSPRIAKNKEILSKPEIIRWLITFQSYTGLSDKVIFGTKKYKSSKGWLFDLGAIFLKGNNLFETVLLNTCILYKENNNIYNIQKPCWEYSSKEIIESYFRSGETNNLAQLYTAYSRGIYIDPLIDFEAAFSFQIVKLPEINHKNKFLEPMTIWRFNKNGENRGTFTPGKHPLNKSLWRSFGLLTMSYDGNSSAKNKQRKPGIMDWLSCIKKEIGNTNVTVSAVSMQDDGNATSWVPTDEILDSLSVSDFVLTDLQNDGWVIRINEVVERTKKVIEVIYKRYISDIKEIRNISSDMFISQKIEELYFTIDIPFRNWITTIDIGMEKDQKVIEWNSALKKLVKNQAKELLYDGGSRDYLGIIANGNIKNIATAYNSFVNKLNKELEEGDENAN